MDVEGLPYARQQLSPRDGPSPALSVRSIASNLSIASNSSRPLSTAKVIYYTVALVLAAGLWLIAGYWAGDLLREWPAPSTLAYLAVSAMQIYFIAVSVRPAFRRIARRSPNQNTEAALLYTDIDLGNDKYTNRETAKMALYLCPILAGAIYMMIYGFQQVPASSYTSLFALSAILATALMTAIGRLDLGLPGSGTGRPWHAAALGLTLLAGAAMFSGPLLQGNIDLDSLTSPTFLFNHGLVLAGSALFALFWVVLAQQCEHTSIQYPLVLAFIGMYTMLVGWIPLVALYATGMELVAFPPPEAAVYSAIILFIFLAVLLPLYMIQEVVQKTSILYALLGFGASLIPIYSAAKSLVVLEFNAMSLLASVLALGALVTINIRFIPVS